MEKFLNSGRSGDRKTDEFSGSALNNRRKCCIFNSGSIVFKLCAVWMMLDFSKIMRVCSFTRCWLFFLSLFFTYYASVPARLGYVDKRADGTSIRIRAAGGGMRDLRFFNYAGLYGSAGKVHRLSCACSGACSGPPSYYCGLG